MGDVLTLIEKAESAVDLKDSEKLAKKFTENTFDMEDLRSYLLQIQKMGSIKSLLGMLPGMGDKVKDIDVDERQFQRIDAIITSMTPAERAKPSIINPSRKKRIAAGSGMKVEDVNRLLKQFEQMQKVMKQFGNFGKGKGPFSSKRMKKRIAGMNLDKMPDMPADADLKSLMKK